MAIGKELGDFSLNITSSVFADDGSSVQVNADGTGSGFGTILGTLTFRGDPGAKAGLASWRGSGFLDNGDQVQGIGDGIWQEIGKHQWRIRAAVLISDGQILATDGTVDLASRSYKGKLLDWS